MLRNLALTTALVAGIASVAAAQGGAVPPGDARPMQGSAPWMGCCLQSATSVPHSSMGHGRTGRGWMGRGWMGGSHMGWNGNGSVDGACPWHLGALGSATAAALPLDTDAVRAMAEQLVAGNPNLAVGDIEEGDGRFIVEVVTRKGEVLVERFSVDAMTGAMRPVR